MGPFKGSFKGSFKGFLLLRVPLRVPVVAKKGVTAIIPVPQGFRVLAAQGV